MKSSACFFVITAGLLLFTLSARGSTLYGSSGNDWILKVDQNTGASTQLGFGAYGNFSDLTSDWRHASFRIWAVEDGGNSLVRINPTTGVATVVGSFGNVAKIPNIGDIGFDVISNTMYGIDGSSLYTINLTTGAASLVGSTGRTNIHSLAFDLTGNLYSVSGSDDLLLQLNTATGNASTIGPMGVGAVRDLAVRPEDGVMFGTTTLGSFAIFRVNTATGAATSVGPYNYSAGITGLAFSPTPEPSSILLLTLGIATLPIHRRKSVPHDRV